MSDVDTGTFGQASLPKVEPTKNQLISNPLSSVLAIIPRLLGMERSKGDVTQLLDRVAEGDSSAKDTLLPRIYLDLHRIATSRLRSERPGHTLQATDLVHEAYLRFWGDTNPKCDNSAQFFGLASSAMRHVLVDHARQRTALKRNCGSTMSLDGVIAFSDDQTAQAVELDELLQQLERLNARAAKVVEMKFFGNFPEKDIAIALQIEIRTVRRDWAKARAWLHERFRPHCPN